MKAINSTHNSELAGNLSVANSYQRRMMGLLGRKSLASGEGLWIKPCMSIHTFGMKFSIDVVFLTKEQYVFKVRSNILPNRVTPLYLSAASVLELPVGKIEETGTKVGDLIDII